VFNANSKNLSMPYCRKTFEYEWFYLYSKNIQSECRPQLKKIMQHTDWTISEYEYETCTQKVPRDQVPQPIKTDLHNIFEIWTLTFFLYSGFLHKKSWPPRYSWNIVESGVKHHNSFEILTKYRCTYTKFQD
jgi:hypothetical protein